jgi:hypothetical protein
MLRKQRWVIIGIVIRMTSRLSLAWNKTMATNESHMNGRDIAQSAKKNKLIHFDAEKNVHSKQLKSLYGASVRG